MTPADGEPSLEVVWKTPCSGCVGPDIRLAISFTNRALIGMTRRFPWLNSRSSERRRPTSLRPTVAAGHAPQRDRPPRRLNRERLACASLALEVRDPKGNVVPLSAAAGAKRATARPGRGTAARRHRGVRVLEFPRSESGTAQRSFQGLASGSTPRTPPPPLGRTSPSRDRVASFRMEPVAVTPAATAVVPSGWWAKLRHSISFFPWRGPRWRSSPRGGN